MISKKNSQNRNRTNNPFGNLLDLVPDIEPKESNSNDLAGLVDRALNFKNPNDLEWSDEERKKRGHKKYRDTTYNKEEDDIELFKRFMAG